MTGRRVLCYFLAFFMVIAIVNAIMMTLAIRTHSGLVTDHPYEKGLAYNNVLKAEKDQEAWGWKSQLDYANGALHFTLRDRKNKPITPDKVTASISRPTQKGLDFVVELGDGETPITFPKKGIWEIRIDAEYNRVHYQQSKRIIVP